MNARYSRLSGLLREDPLIRVPERDRKESFVGSSIQFNVPTFTVGQMSSLIDRCSEAGLHLNWFGRERMNGFTSRPDQWEFLGSVQALPKATGILRTLCDMRIPPTLPLSDCEIAVEVIRDAIREAAIEATRKTQ